MIARRELPHPGAQLNFTDVDGYRYQVFITDHPEDDVASSTPSIGAADAVERRIRDAKDTGLANLPSASFAINAAWLALVLIAGDLLVWMKGLCLEGELARPSPSDCATRSCTQPGCLVRSARRTTLRIAEGWPWADDLVVTARSNTPGFSREHRPRADPSRSRVVDLATHVPVAAHLSSVDGSSAHQRLRHRAPRRRGAVRHRTGPSLGHRSRLLPGGITKVLYDRLARFEISPRRDPECSDWTGSATRQVTSARRSSPTSTRTTSEGSGSSARPTSSSAKPSGTRCRVRGPSCAAS